MKLKNLQRKAFWLFFSAAFLLIWSVIGVIALCGPTLHVGIVAPPVLLSFIFAWVMTRHPDSLDEKIRQWKAQELADEAWTFFRRSNPVGWLVWLWQKAV